MLTTQFTLTCTKAGLWTLKVLDDTFLDSRLDCREVAGHLIRSLGGKLPQNSPVVVIDLAGCSDLNDNGLSCLVEVEIWLKSATRVAIALDLPSRRILSAAQAARFNLLLDRNNVRGREIRWLSPHDDGNDPGRRSRTPGL